MSTPTNQLPPDIYQRTGLGGTGVQLYRICCSSLGNMEEPIGYGANLEKAIEDCKQRNNWPPTFKSPTTSNKQNKEINLDNLNALERAAVTRLLREVYSLFAENNLYIRFDEVLDILSEQVRDEIRRIQKSFKKSN